MDIVNEKVKALIKDKNDLKQRVEKLEKDRQNPTAFYTVVGLLFALLVVKIIRH